ncbi:aconitate hydratase AcnA [Staphylococcus argenteus]|uniref:aconitate hydratase AcnA n=1 Tax=Staphylococcus argenteus TaxID=985002 RepID=UPI00178CBB78|nr:aconitate hydratase AcnA [Staphylococcus argenteus]MBE2133709.1 aconitate hydratase AcnA [Staphylococcus argenteus]
MAANFKEQSKKHFDLNGQSYTYYDLKAVEDRGITKVSNLPYSIRVLLESLLRQEDDFVITDEHIKALSQFGEDGNEGEVPFKPSRVILQDFTGVPAVVDLASLRKAMDDVGGDISKINPEVPVDLVIDHSVQVDSYAALERNMKLEFERNYERYQFLNWATKAFDNYNAVPPATGIVHQVNLEYLASVVHVRDVDGEKTAFPDTLVGTDSHTTMINGIGVLGWGVGGIEAEAGMLGQPSYFPIPEVIGVRLVNSLPQGATATDLALRVTQELRKKGVVGKFVEFFGPGVQHLPLADRATIANMAPEYGATCGFFPVDDESLKYMKLTGRSDEHIALVKEYLQQNHMFFDVEKEDPNYTDVIELDLATVEASLSGPKRPQDLIFLSDMKTAFEDSVTAPAGNQGHGLDKSEFDKKAEIEFKDGSKASMKTGDIAIAAITSCTNTSNPYVMLGAGLVAKKAVEKGLKVPEYVKTSLAPGSKVVTGYLRDSGLQTYLDDLGFNLVGYGCTTCIGNSGPLLPEIEKAIADEDLLVTSVLSGNRNFEGRIHPLVKANYLASPQLVVAYALAGTVDIDLQNEPIGKGKDGEDVYLQDIWPTIKEVSDTVDSVVTPELFIEEYKNVYNNNELWNEIDVTDQPLYDFDPNSTYIQNPSFFQGLSKEPGKIVPLSGLRVMGKFGDSVTTDHISPAGAIGTFANIRIKNQLAPGTEGGFTTYWPTNEVMPIFDAAMKYKEDGTGLVVLAGNDYGMGSSRDWAAKGTNLLGVKTVIAQSYERIHRSNLVMMGVLPLEFRKGESADALGLDGTEEISVNIDENVQPHDFVKVTAKKQNGELVEFDAMVRFDSLVEMDYYRHGGILQMVLRNKLAQ